MSAATAACASDASPVSLSVPDGELPWYLALDRSMGFSVALSSDGNAMVGGPPRQVTLRVVWIAARASLSTTKSVTEGSFPRARRLGKQPSRSFYAN